VAGTRDLRGDYDSKSNHAGFNSNSCGGASGYKEGENRMQSIRTLEILERKKRGSKRSVGKRKQEEEERGR